MREGSRLKLLPVSSCDECLAAQSMRLCVLFCSFLRTLSIFAYVFECVRGLSNSNDFKSTLLLCFVVVCWVAGRPPTSHCCAIQEKSDEFYRQFHVVVTGLDSVPARSWMNAKLVELAKVDASGELDMATVIPMVDGGTSGESYPLLWFGCS